MGQWPPGTPWQWHIPGLCYGEVMETTRSWTKSFAWSWNTCSATTYDAQDILTHELRDIGSDWWPLHDGLWEQHDVRIRFERWDQKKTHWTDGDIAGLIRSISDPLLRRKFLTKKITGLNHLGGGRRREPSQEFGSTADIYVDICWDR